MYLSMAAQLDFNVHSQQKIVTAENATRNKRNMGDQFSRDIQSGEPLPHQTSPVGEQDPAGEHRH
jgi:hypothetical protein